MLGVRRNECGCAGRQSSVVSDTVKMVSYG